jgi:hypothetical protein
LTSLPQSLAQKRLIDFVDAESLNFGNRHELTSRLIWAEHRRIISHSSHGEDWINEIWRWSAPVGTLRIQVSAVNESDHGYGYCNPAALFANFPQESLLNRLSTLTATANA